MNILEGDCGGIIFRGDANGSLYLFRVCQDGYFNLSLYVDNLGINARNLLNGLSPAINTGLKQSNTLAIVADGSMLSLYMNHQKIGSIGDSTYTHGSIGLIASAVDNPTEVAYSNVKVWKVWRA